MSKRTAQVANLLDQRQVGNPEVAIGQESRATTRPAHLLREEGARRRGADTGGEAERNVADFPTTVDGTESVHPVSATGSLCDLFAGLDLPSVNVL